MKKRRLVIIKTICLFSFIASLTASAVEPAGSSVIKDIQYQSFQDGVRLSIIMDDHVDYVSYEVEDPYRVIIDPLDEVYCDYEDKVFFEEGLIKSIEFIKTMEEGEAMGDFYYAFDFLAVELGDSASYEVIKDGPSILLDVTAPGAKATSFIKESEITALELEELISAEKTPLPEEEPMPTLKVSPEKAKPHLEGGHLPEEETVIAKAKPQKIPHEIPPAFVLPDLSKELNLEGCINIAVENHLPLRIADEQVKLVKLKVNESFRELFPTASLLWSESHGMISEELYRGRKFGFEFKQPLFHGGELFFTWEQSKVNLKLAQENYNKVKEELVHDVAKAYYNLAKAMNNLDFQKDLYEAIESDLELAKREYDEDLSTQLEFLNAQTSYDQAYYSAAAAENDVSLKRLALNKVMNIDISAQLKIKYLLELKEFDINIDECMALAVQYRAELKTKELLVKSTELGERIAKSQLWPQLDVVGKYVKAAEEVEPRALGWNLRNERFLGITLDVPVADHTLSVAHKRGKLAPTVTTFASDTKYNTDLYKITPFDDLSRYTSIKSADIAHKQALSDLNDVKRKINAEVMEAFYSLKEAQIKLKGSDNNLELYEKELLAAQVKKGMNEATTSEVMDAKIKLFSEKTSYINALADIYLAIAGLNKAIGIGGYFK